MDDWSEPLVEAQRAVKVLEADLTAQDWKAARLSLTMLGMLTEKIWETIDKQEGKNG